MKKYFLQALFMPYLLLLVACSGPKNDPTKEADGTPKKEDHADEKITTLTEEQIKSIGITFGAIEQKQLTRSLKTTGMLRVPNQNKATINSLYSGVVKTLLVQPGDIVRKGQTIASIANPEFVQVQSNYLSVDAKIGLAELEVKRQKELNAGNAGALKNLQAAETELRTLRTAKSTYEQQIRLMGINPSTLSNGNLISVLSITSPISGVVSSVKVEMGSFIDLSTPIAEIVDNSQLHLDLFVYEKELPKLKENQLIHFTLTNNPGREYDAQIYSLGSSFEGESKAVTVHAKVQGDKTGLIDGMNITAVISLEKTTVPAVPTESIVTMQGQDFIFITVADTGEHEEGETGFEMIPVARGTTDVGYTEITPLKEIPPGATIVTKGAFFIMAKFTNAGGHEH